MKRKLMSDLSPTERKMTLTVSFIAAYARLTELRALESAVTIIPVQPQDREDLVRLQKWWTGLGEERQGLIVTWKDALWIEVEACTAEYFQTGKGN